MLVKSVIFISIIVIFSFIFSKFEKRTFTDQNSGIVVVTGCSSFIIRQMMAKLAGKNRKFYYYCGVDDKNSVNLSQEDYVLNFQTISLNILSSESVNNAVKLIKTSSEELDWPIVAVINFQDFNSDEFVNNNLQLSFESNFYGIIELTNHFFPLIKSNKGRIIHISQNLYQLTQSNSINNQILSHTIEAYFQALRNGLQSNGVSVSIIQISKLFLKQSLSSENHLFESDLNELSRSIEHALTWKFPLTTYSVGKIYGIQINVFQWIWWLLTDRMKDYTIQFL